jgi:hypothetical protein
MSVEVGPSALDFAPQDRNVQVARLSGFWPQSLLVNPRPSEQVPGRVSGKADAGGPDSGAVGAGENAAGRRPGAAQPGYGGFPKGSHGAVVQDCGVFRPEAGRSSRGTFLIGTDGVLRRPVVNEPGRARPLAAYREAIAAL